MIQVPPIIFYFLGGLLIVFGALRAYHLGWKRRQSAVSEQNEARARQDRRHIAFGILWVAMGLFLVISTILNSRPR